jgi:L-fucose mutarotase
MLKSRLLHPEIQEALGRAGHSSKILIADGNYPFATQLGPNARLVLLNLSPGLVNVTQVLEAIVSAAFFDAGKDQNVALTIATGEQRLYANLLLQIGVVFPESVDEPGTRARAI